MPLKILNFKNKVLIFKNEEATVKFHFGDMRGFTIELSLPDMDNSQVVVVENSAAIALADFILDEMTPKAKNDLEEIPF